MNTQRNSYLSRFFQLESASGILLILAAILALIIKNSPLYYIYDELIQKNFSIQFGSYGLTKPLLLWINEGLMVVFFLLVGLELKREIIEGELSSLNKVMLPSIGAIGGMIAPAFIYFLINHKNPLAISGWAIPTATDIAFALGVMTLLGNKVPLGLKIFLTSLAIFDDIGAIVIIALFYSCGLNMIALIILAICVVILFILNRFHVTRLSVYIMIGIFMWVALLKSGIHATLTGVILAFFIPLKPSKGSDVSLLKRMEQHLHFSVSFIILPLFAFVNSGLYLNFNHQTLTQAIFNPVPLGVLLGLFFGKQVGIFGSCWLAIKLKIAKKPNNISWMMLYGTSILCGIGFTMSLFIGSLSFKECGLNNSIIDERFGIMLGSLFSGTVGYFVLRYALNKSHKN